MTPEQLAKPNTEHAHQVAFMCWCQQQDHDPRLKMSFAIPNGGERNKIVASRLKAEGVKQGVPDVFVPIPVGKWHGLWIEFKKPGDDKKAKGKLSKKQKEWREYLLSQNYGHFVAFGYLPAVQCCVNYLQS